MKTKLFLMLFALNGLLLGANSASATPANQSVSSLSHTISNLVDLDADAQILLESAINRALLAKNDKELRIGQQTIPKPAEPIINGRVANPKPSGPIINGRVANPHPKPLIDTKPPILINGIIYHPNQQSPHRQLLGE
jgi:hypothetical protein